jgi:hypothetical protein
MPRPLLFLFPLFLACSAQAQFDTSFIKKNIRHCADSMTHAFKTRSWDVFTRYSYPSVVGSLGGKKAFSDFMAGMFAPIPDSAWKKYEVGSILQVIKKGKDIQAIIELNSTLEWQGSRIITTSHLVAESWDGGLFWTFFDSQNDRMAAKLIDPNLSDELIIPEKQEKREPLPAAKGRQ